MERDEEDLTTVAMLPSHERLVWLHRRLDPTGKSLLSVEQLVKNLQDDFKRRNAALDRALHLLRAVWDESSHGTEVVSREANFANHWNDVLRWVNDEEKSAMSEDEVIALAHEMGWREMDENKNDRWSGFSDEELQALREMSSQRSTSQSLDHARRQVNVGVQKEQARREAERPSYRGPGVYVAGSRRLEVLGTIGDPDAMGTQAQVVMRDEGDHSGILMQEYLHQFNEVGAYEYLGPLKDANTEEVKRLKRVLRRVHNHDQATTDVRSIVESAILFGNDEPEVAPIAINLVDAGQGWAVIENPDGRRARVSVGDAFVVPTLVTS